MLTIRDLTDILPNHYTDVDRELILRAHRVAAEAHAPQKRLSGEPYITHCIAVAQILVDLHVPPAVIAAGLLHDTVEDTAVTLPDLERDFTPEIARLVDGVTKLTELPRVSRGEHADEVDEDEANRELAAVRGLPNPEEEARSIARKRNADLVNETLRKTFIAMGEDPRVMLIKLADRLHNMRTLKSMPAEKQRRIAQETLDIFAPIANRLGIWQVKWQLEDLAFRYVDPDTYKEIAEKLAERRTEREQELQAITDMIEELLKGAGITADINARPKHIYSIYRKMRRKGVAFDQIYDVRGLRVMVDSEDACYVALGLIHRTWRPVPGEFDDYIAAPKDNFYKSLHTAVRYEDGRQVEVQIRTPDMHQNAEYGIAAHWRYKEGQPQDEVFQRRVEWLRRLMDWRQDVEDADEFVEAMKTDVFQDRVYAFTPRGDVIDLPTGATPIDFAYYIHTEVGHRCRGAKVNGKLVSLDHQLNTGDQVEVLAAKRGGPSRDWLNHNLGLVNSARARAKIKRWFKVQAREQNLAQGKIVLEKELRRLGMTQTDIGALAGGSGIHSVDDFYVAIGAGDVPLGRIVNRLKLEEEAQKGDDFIIPTRQGASVDQRAAEVVVMGMKGLFTNMARCCNPAPGDQIVGYITRGRGATVHRRDCPNVLNVRDQDRLLPVSWGQPQVTYPVAIQVEAYDRGGLVRDISAVIADEEISISDGTVKTGEKFAIFNLVLDVKDISQLSKVLNKIEQLPTVSEARRLTPG
jgi:GTP pyrophosphokinase